jgi:large subunit ribosomal protein L18
VSRNTSVRLVARLKRKKRVRSRVSGTADRPRLSVFRSARHIYAQVIDDVAGKTLAAASSLSPDVRGETAELAARDTAKKVGELIAARCKEAGVAKVVFDKNGFIYHKNGRLASLADAARKAGLDF